MSTPDLTDPTTTALSRRQALCGVVAALAVPAALAACSTTTSPSTTTATTPAAAGTKLGAAADVPVGSGIIVTGPDSNPWVLVQPTAGTVRAFTAICTHQGTRLPAPVKGVITCPLHKSQFDANTGAVLRDPAKAPLPEHKVTVKDGQIVTV